MRSRGVLTIGRAITNPYELNGYVTMPLNRSMILMMIDDQLEVLDRRSSLSDLESSGLLRFE